MYYLTNEGQVLNTFPACATLDTQVEGEKTRMKKQQTS